MDNPPSPHNHSFDRTATVVAAYAHHFVDGSQPPAEVLALLTTLHNTSSDDDTDEYNKFLSEAKQAIDNILESTPKPPLQILADHETWAAANIPCITSYVKHIELMLVDCQQPMFDFKEMVLYHALETTAPQLLHTVSNSIATTDKPIFAPNRIFAWINRINQNREHDPVQPQLLMILFDKIVVRSKKNRQLLGRLIQNVDDSSNPAALDTFLTSVHRQPAYKQLISTFPNASEIYKSAVFRSYVLCCHHRHNRLNNQQKTKAHRNTPYITHQDLINADHTLSFGADETTSSRRVQLPATGHTTPQRSLAAPKPPATPSHPLPPQPTIPPPPKRNNAQPQSPKTPIQHDKQPDTRQLPQRPKPAAPPTRLQLPSRTINLPNVAPSKYLPSHDNSPRTSAPTVAAPQPATTHTTEEHIAVYHEAMSEKQWLTAIITILDGPSLQPLHPTRPNQSTIATAILRKHALSHQRRCPTVPSFDNIHGHINDLDAVKISPVKPTPPHNTIRTTIQRWQAIHVNQFAPERVRITPRPSSVTTSQTSTEALRLWTTRKTNSVSAATTPIAIQITGTHTSQHSKLNSINIFNRMRTFMSAPNAIDHRLRPPLTQLTSAGFLSPWQNEPFGTWASVTVEDSPINSVPACIVVYTNSPPDSGQPPAQPLQPPADTPTAKTPYTTLPSRTKVASLQAGDTLLIPPGYYHRELLILDAVMSFDRSWFACRMESTLEHWHNQLAQQANSTHSSTLDRAILEHIISHTAYQWSKTTLAALVDIHRITSTYDINTRTCVCTIKGHVNCQMRCNTQKRKQTLPHDQMQPPPNNATQLTSSANSRDSTHINLHPTQPHTPKRRLLAHQPDTI